MNVYALCINVYIVYHFISYVVGMVFSTKPLTLEHYIVCCVKFVTRLRHLGQIVYLKSLWTLPLPYFQRYGNLYIHLVKWSVMNFGSTWSVQDTLNCVYIKSFFFLLYLDLYMRRIFKGMCMIKHVAQRCLHIDKMRVLVCQYSGGTEHEAHLRLILPSCNSWHRYH